MQREETDRMGQMERGHTAEVQPDCMTEAYTVGISETHIRNNATVFRVWQMIEHGELTREEGLYLMVNTLAYTAPDDLPGALLFLPWRISVSETLRS